MKKTKTISLAPVADLSGEMQDFSPVSIAIGPQNEWCFLLVREYPPLIGGSFPSTVTKEQYHYKVIIMKGNEKKVIDLPDEKWNYHYVQTIDDDQVLLAGARSYYHDADHIEKNARVYTSAGQCIRSFCLGDGIQDLYVTDSNTIWTSYFDEGVFGNYGWDEPIGSKGLIHWDAFGRQLEWHDPKGEHYIDDCYAMNIVSNEEVWFYYYSDFHIGVRVEGHTDYYVPDVKGANLFAVKEDMLLMDGGYGNHDGFYELKRKGSRYRTQKHIRFIKPNGVAIRSSARSNRGNQLLFLDGTEVYYYEI
ncbi:hypothetical protein [Sporosarcina sp. FSL W7-1283]|uniref:hypothetical protein n=1 Tax=Sporosarcina sp. FSL W7-1283 TaxID=2921560 RepID=UPI0030F946EE